MRYYGTSFVHVKATESRAPSWASLALANLINLPCYYGISMRSIGSKPPISLRAAQVRLEGVWCDSRREEGLCSFRTRLAAHRLQRLKAASLDSRLSALSFPYQVILYEKRSSLPSSGSK